jgi:hypothetical protein
VARLIDSRREGAIFRSSAVRAWGQRVTREIGAAAADYALWRLRAYNASDFRYDAGPKTGTHSRGYKIINRGYSEVINSAVSANWLEGTGSRNSRSRFKGYHHWRRARADVERAAVRIANQVIARAVGRLN